MKILFLDFDGCLNGYGSHSSVDENNMSKICCKNLNHILSSVPDLNIVVSSSWRRHGLKFCKLMLQGNGIDAKRAIDITGNENGNRGYQIGCWLNSHPEVSNFAILDDSSDMGDYINKLVRTIGFVGLTESDAEKVIEMLKK